MAGTGRTVPSHIEVSQLAGVPRPGPAAAQRPGLPRRDPDHPAAADDLDLAGDRGRHRRDPGERALPRRPARRGDPASSTSRPGRSSPAARPVPCSSTARACTLDGRHAPRTAGRPRCCTASTWRWPGASCWSCSARPARASRRCCGWSPGSSRPPRGRVVIAGRDVTRLRPGRRNVSMVFQSYALFPHLTVAENIALRPAWCATCPGPRRASGPGAAAEAVGCAHLLDRRPGQLSGGERQRVALARALVREPDVFLLDEPLSNLDLELRVGTRAELRALHDRVGATMVHVTHDQTEALVLGDRIAVLRDGRDRAGRHAGRDLAPPATTFVARFVGSPAMNLLPADGPLRPLGEPLRRAARRRPADRLPARGRAARLGRRAREGVVERVDVVGEDAYAYLRRRPGTPWSARVRAANRPAVGDKSARRGVVVRRARLRRGHRPAGRAAMSSTRRSPGRRRAAAARCSCWRRTWSGWSSWCCVPVAVTLALAFTDYDLIRAPRVDRPGELRRAGRATRPSGPRWATRWSSPRSPCPLRLLIALGLALLLHRRAPAAGTARTAAVLPDRRARDRVRPAVAVAVQPALRPDQPAAPLGGDERADRASAAPRRSG